MTLGELQTLVREAKASSVSGRNVEQIFAPTERIVRTRDAVNE